MKHIAHVDTAYSTFAIDKQFGCGTAYSMISILCRIENKNKWISFRLEITQSFGFANESKRLFLQVRQSLHLYYKKLRKGRLIVFL